ncbi:unnamed protein product [Meloidogyne enterolobii]|uniref:Uncharacterized protein n=1 Tax=Meloidogyne enterolobii TaxID=390850 RepID=A0ACB1AIM1_MELEN
MNVNVVISRQASIVDMDKIMYLNPNWIPKLRLFLGTEFEEVEKSKIKWTRTGIWLKFKNFENALKGRVNALSEYVQEKEKIEKETEKSFLNLLSDTKVLDINTANEKPLAILDKVEHGKNVEIPFDLFFLDFIKEIKYGTIIHNKVDNKPIFKENQKMSFKTYSMDYRLLSNLQEMIRKPSFLSEKIITRYYCMANLFSFGMEALFYNSQSSLTRTGKVYKTFPDGKELWYNDFSEADEIISVQIFETETTIQIESETPMAIVELIEEVKNEREELKEMNDEEFKKKREKSVMEEIVYELKKELNEKLKEIKKEHDRIFEEKKKRVGKLVKEELNENENNKELKEKLDNKRNEYNKLLEEKIKVEKFKILKESIEDGRKIVLEKYNDFIVELKEMWSRAIFYQVFNEVYKKEEKKNVKIKFSNEKEKGEASSSKATIQDKQDEHLPHFDENGVIRKTFLLKIYGKENAVKLVKGKKDSAIFVNIYDENTLETNDGKLYKSH